MKIYCVVRRHPRHKTSWERISSYAVTPKLAIANMAYGEKVKLGDKIRPDYVMPGVPYIDAQGYTQHPRSEDYPVKRKRKNKRNCGPCRMRNPRRSRRAKVSARRIKRYVKGRRSVTISTRRLKRRGRRWIALQRRRARGRSPYMSMIERKYSKNPMKEYTSKTPNAVIDSFTGLIPVKVLQVIEGGYGQRTTGGKIKVRVKNSSGAGGWKKGEIVTLPASRVVPVKQIIKGTYSYRINPVYLWK